MNENNNSVQNLNDTAAPAVQEAAAPAVQEAAPAVQEAAPAVQEAAPAVQEAAAPTVQEAAAPAVQEAAAPAVQEAAAPAVQEAAAPAVQEAAAPGIPVAAAPTVPVAAAPIILQNAAPTAQTAAVPEKPKKGKAKFILIAAAAALLFIGIVSGIVYRSAVVIPARKYAAASELFDSGKYEEAIAAFEELGDYKDAAAKKAEAEQEVRNAADYSDALVLLDAGKYNEAYDAFTALSGYLDSDQKAEEIHEEYLTLKGQLRHCEVGDEFELYVDDISRDIKWKVVAVEDGRVMLTQKYRSGYEPETIKKTDLKNYIFSFNSSNTILLNLKSISKPEISDRIDSVFFLDEEIFKNYIKDTDFVIGDDYATLMIIGKGPAWNMYNDDKTLRPYYNCRYVGTDMAKNGECENKLVAVRLFIWVDVSD